MKTKKFHLPESILFENADFFVVNKLPFISTLSDRSGAKCLLDYARAYKIESQACHRLDKETSGALVFAKHPGAYRHLNMQFEHREVDKVYHALVDGIHLFENRKVLAPIQKLTDGTVAVQSRGKQAETYFDTLKAYKNHTLVECRPTTGRMHQIRIHLSHVGAPITGDIQYGGKLFFLSSVKRGFKTKKWTEEEPLIKRFALHAFKLRFKGLDGEIIEVEAPYPPDFAALIKQLEKAF